MCYQITVLGCQQLPMSNHGQSGLNYYSRFSRRKKTQHQGYDGSVCTARSKQTFVDFASETISIYDHLNTYSNQQALGVSTRRDSSPNHRLYKFEDRQSEHVEQQRAYTSNGQLRSQSVTVGEPQVIDHTYGHCRQHIQKWQQSNREEESEILQQVSPVFPSLIQRASQLEEESKSSSEVFRIQVQQISQIYSVNHVAPAKYLRQKPKVSSNQSTGRQGIQNGCADFKSHQLRQSQPQGVPRIKHNFKKIVSNRNVVQQMGTKAWGQGQSGTEGFIQDRLGQTHGITLQVQESNREKSKHALDNSYGVQYAQLLQPLDGTGYTEELVQSQKSRGRKNPDSSPTLEDKLEQVYQMNFNAPRQAKQPNQSQLQLASSQRFSKTSDLLISSRPISSVNFNYNPQYKSGPKTKPVLKKRSPDSSSLSLSQRSQQSPLKHVYFQEIQHQGFQSQDQIQLYSNQEAQQHPLGDGTSHQLQKQIQSFTSRKQRSQRYQDLIVRLGSLQAEVDELDSLKRVSYSSLIRKLTDNVRTAKEQFQTRKQRLQYTLQQKATESIVYYKYAALIQDATGEYEDILLNKIILHSLVRSLATRIGQQFKVGPQG